jgi:hypothetical protein
MSPNESSVIGPEKKNPPVSHLLRRDYDKRFRPSKDDVWLLPVCHVCANDVSVITIVMQ